MHRSDAFPGRPSEYGDDGCEVAPHCTECPLPICQYDLPPNERAALRNRARDELILVAAAQGARRSEIAAAAGLSERSIYRLLQEAK